MPPRPPSGRWSASILRGPTERTLLGLAAQLAAAGVELGKTYPHPIVDHDKARRRALMNVRSLA